MKKIWNYVTPEEVLDFYKQIEKMCNEKGYDVDAGINRLYERNLKGIKNPVKLTSYWIEHILSEELREVLYV